MAVLRALGMDDRRIAAQLDLEKHDVRVFSLKPGEIILRRNMQQQSAHLRPSALDGQKEALKLAATFLAYAIEMIAGPRRPLARVVTPNLWPRSAAALMTGTSSER